MVEEARASPAQMPYASLELPSAARASPNLESDEGPLSTDAVGPSHWMRWILPEGVVPVSGTRVGLQGLLARARELEARGRALGFIWRLASPSHRAPRAHRRGGRSGAVRRRHALLPGAWISGALREDLRRAPCRDASACRSAPSRSWSHPGRSRFSSSVSSRRVIRVTRSSIRVRGFQSTSRSYGLRCDTRTAPADGRHGLRVHRSRPRRPADAAHAPRHSQLTREPDRGRHPTELNAEIADVLEGHRSRSSRMRSTPRCSSRGAQLVASRPSLAGRRCWSTVLEDFAMTGWRPDRRSPSHSSSRLRGCSSIRSHAPLPRCNLRGWRR